MFKDHDGRSKKITRGYQQIVKQQGDMTIRKGMQTLTG
jgi:hypothetical protein